MGKCHEIGDSMQVLIMYLLVWYMRVYLTPPSILSGFTLAI